MKQEEALAGYAEAIERQRRQARKLYASILVLVEQEAKAIGAQIEVLEFDHRLPRDKADKPLAVRFNISPGSVVLARQVHVSESVLEVHRSWPTDLDCAPMVPPHLRRGIVTMLTTIARLQGVQEKGLLI